MFVRFSRFVLPVLMIMSAMPYAAKSAPVTPTTMQTVLLPLVVKPGSSQTVPGLPWDPYATRTGQATYYTATGAGNCSYEATPDDLMVAAMNQVDYANSLICGAYVEITGPKGMVTVRIADRCPECPVGNIDLSQEAFARIANPVDGRVPITWRIVSPALGDPIAYRFKEGSSQWWTAVQIRNHRNPVYKVEYRTAAGAWKTLARQEYNYFIDDQGMGPGPYTLRVTDIYGHVITDNNIPLTVGGIVAGSAQFPPQP